MKRFKLAPAARVDAEKPGSRQNPRAGRTKRNRSLAVQQHPIAIFAQSFLTQLQEQLLKGSRVSFLKSLAKAAPCAAEKLAHAIILPRLFQKGASLGIHVEERGRGGHRPIATVKATLPWKSGLAPANSSPSTKKPIPTRFNHVPVDWRRSAACE